MQMSKQWASYCADNNSAGDKRLPDIVMCDSNRYDQTEFCL